MSSRVLTTLLASLLATGTLSVPSALADDAPTTDDPTATIIDVVYDDGGEAADDSSDDSADACDSSDDSEDSSDDDTSAEERRAAFRQDDASADDSDVADDAGDDSADEDTADDESCDDATDDDVLQPGDSPLASLKSLLAGGSFDAGAVGMSGPGTLTEQLVLGNGKAVAAAARVSRSSKVRGVTLGTARKAVKKAGVTHLTIKLTKQGRKALKKAGKKGKVTLKVTKTRRGRSIVTTHRVKLK